MNINNKFQDFISWATYEADRSPNTIRIYKEAYTSYVMFLNEKNIIPSLSTKILRQYFFYLREKGLKKTTVLLRYKSLKAFVKYLIIIDKSLNINPFDDIFKPQPDNNLPDFFSLKEAKDIMEAVEGYNWPTRFIKFRNILIIRLLFFCGLRKSELLNLTLSDINLQEEYLRINNGKGNKDRIIKLHQSVVFALNKYLKYRGDRKINKLLVCSTRYQQPFSESGLKRFMNLLKRQTGINSIYPHKFRHSFATLLLHSGASIEIIRQVLGHTKLSTTAKYLHCSPDMQTDHLNKHPLG